MNTITLKNRVGNPDSHLYNLAMQKIRECFALFNQITGKNLQIPDSDALVFFNQSRVGGYVCPARYGNRVFLNWPLFKANTESYLNQTIPHEVAHIFQRSISSTERSHGPIWQGLMRKIGLRPDRCHNYDTTVSARYETYTYICKCQKHKVSKIIHNKMLKGQKRTCRACKDTVIYIGS
jgi:SprT protein